MSYLSENQLSKQTLIQYKLPTMLDAITLDHSRRVGNITLQLAMDVGVPWRALNTLGQAAVLHDIGKIFIPHEIIEKPTHLSPDEYKTIQSHALLGYEFLREISALEAILGNVVLYHHENFDGSGYPYGLAGETIPLEARIIHITDYYDALTSVRPYRDAYSTTDAIRIMTDHQELFDPDILETFFQGVW